MAKANHQRVVDRIINVVLRMLGDEIIGPFVCQSTAKAKFVNAQPAELLMSE